MINIYVVHFFHQPEQIPTLLKQQEFCKKASTSEIKYNYRPCFDSNQSEFELPIELKQVKVTYPFANNFGQRKQDIIWQYQSFFDQSKDNITRYILFLDGDETINHFDLKLLSFYLPTEINFNNPHILGFPRINRIKAVGNEEYKILQELQDKDNPHEVIQKDFIPSAPIPDEFKEYTLTNWKYPDIQQRMVLLTTPCEYIVKGLTHEKIYKVEDFEDLTTHIMWSCPILHTKTVEEQIQGDKLHRDLLQG